MQRKDIESKLDPQFWEDLNALRARLEDVKVRVQQRIDQKLERNPHISNALAEVDERFSTYENVPADRESYQELLSTIYADVIEAYELVRDHTVKAAYEGDEQVIELLTQSEVLLQILVEEQLRILGDIYSHKTWPNPNE